jgi:hypothetical protein
MSVNEFVFLDIQELRTPFNLSALPLVKDGRGSFTGASARNSFAMIQMDVASGSVKSFKENTDFHMSAHFPHPIDVVSRLTISWLDSSGKELDFQGAENNSFVLRFHSERKKAELPPPPPLIDVELKRIVDALTLKPPEPEPEKKRVLGRWAIWLVFLVSVVGYMLYRTYWPKHE